MRIAICDDKKEDIAIARKELENICLKLDCKMDIYEFIDGNIMVQDIIENKIEVVLLDIDMPEINGMDIANSLVEKVPFITIIFLTNQVELVFQTIKYRPLRFVRKSCLKDELEEAIQAAIQKNASEMYVLHFAGENTTSSYPIRDILYVESKGHYMEIHIKEEVKRIRGKLSEYEKKLEEYGFIRIHIGYLVNVRYISMLNSQGVELDNGETLPVSKQNLKAIQIKYTKGLEKFVHGCRL
ncbi:MAG: LytR/AlgR family response regulator transcription factor [Lachnospiraceae bacterium]